MSEETKIVGEAEEQHANPQRQEEVIEQKARDKGWKPEEEFKGNPEDWVPAKEFIGRQKLYDTIRDLKGDVFKQSRKFENDLTVITQHFEKVREADFKRALEQAKAERKEAMRAGDADGVEVAESKIEKVEADRAEAQRARPQVQRSQGPTPEFVEWQSKNAWFQSDKEMTEEAVAIGTGYAAMHPELNQNQILEHVEKRVRKMFPDRFESQEERKQAAGVESGNGGRKAVSSGKKGKLSVSDLDEGEVQIMKILLKRGTLKKKAEANKISQEEQYLRDVQEYETAKGQRR